MSKATEDKMNKLHGQLAETLTTMVKVRTVIRTDKEGNEYEEDVDPSPAALAVAAKFLKDNAVTMTPEQSTAVDELEDALTKRRAANKGRAKVTKADMDAALKAVGSSLIQ